MTWCQQFYGWDTCCSSQNGSTSPCPLMLTDFLCHFPLSKHDNCQEHPISASLHSHSHRVGINPRGKNTNELWQLDVIHLVLCHRCHPCTFSLIYFHIPLGGFSVLRVALLRVLLYKPWLSWAAYFCQTADRPAWSSKKLKELFKEWLLILYRHSLSS